MKHDRALNTHSSIPATGKFHKREPFRERKLRLVIDQKHDPQSTVGYMPHFRIQGIVAVEFKVDPVVNGKRFLAINFDAGAAG